MGLRRRVRVGAKARARIRAGGPTSVHRKALPRKEWVALREYIYNRDGSLCRACGEFSCYPLDIHHIQKRSQGGPDSPENLIVLGRRCHDRTDWPFSKGRLVIRHVADQRFAMAIVTAPDKATGKTREAELLRMAEQALQG